MLSYIFTFRAMSNLFISIHLMYFIFVSNVNHNNSQFICNYGNKVLLLVEGGGGGEGSDFSYNCFVHGF